MKKQFEEVTKQIKNIESYKILLSFIIIFLGFLYVQGLYSSFLNKDLNFTFTTFFNMGFINIPINIYIIQGSIFLFLSFIQLILAYILLLSLKKIKFFKKIFLLIQYPFIVFIILIITSICLFSLNQCIHSFSRTHHMNIFYMQYLILMMSNIVLILEIMSIVKICEFNTFSDIYKSPSKLLCLVCILCVVTFYTHYNGYISQEIKITSSLYKNINCMNFVKVYIKEDKSSEITIKNYCKILLTDKQFIGWDDTEKTIVIISLDNIKKIEKWNVVDNPKAYYRYDIELESNHNSDKYLCAMTIKNYYENRFKTKDAVTIQKLLTTNCYDEKYYGINPVVLSRIWKNTPFNESTLDNTPKKESKEPLYNFYGFTLSIPKKENNKYKVFVIESWKHQENVVCYTLIKENATWLINNIESQINPITFKSFNQKD